MRLISVNTMRLKKSLEHLLALDPFLHTVSVIEHAHIFVYIEGYRIEVDCAFDFLMTFFFASTGINMEMHCYYNWNTGRKQMVVSILLQLWKVMLRTFERLEGVC
jgi:hypothetical protein